MKYINLAVLYFSLLISLSVNASNALPSRPSKNPPSRKKPLKIPFNQTPKYPDFRCESNFYPSYYEPGARWTLEVVRDYTPSRSVFIVEYTVKEEVKIGGYKCLPIYKEEITKGKLPELVTYLRHEGYKILFHNEEMEETEWYEMYDFSLKPGDESELFYPTYIEHETGEPLSCEVLCVETPAEIAYEGWEVMTVCEIMEQDSSYLTTWLVRFGNIQDPLWPCYKFNEGRRMVTEIYNAEGKCLYSRPGHISVYSVPSIPELEHIEESGYDLYGNKTDNLIQEGFTSQED